MEVKDAKTEPRRSTERLEARMTPAQKRLIARAAALQGRSITDFVVSTAEEQARSVVRDFDVITLTQEDSERFAQAILDPPPPNARLRRAAKQYADKFRSS
jgi:uncharacterized protein (DUF1778 family)